MLQKKMPCPIYGVVKPRFSIVSRVFTDQHVKRIFWSNLDCPDSQLKQRSVELQPNLSGHHQLHDLHGLKEDFRAILRLFLSSQFMMIHNIIMAQIDIFYFFFGIYLQSPRMVILVHRIATVEHFLCLFTNTIESQRLSH